MAARARDGWSIKTKSLALFAGYVLALGAVYFAFTIFLLQREREAAHDHLQQTAAMLAGEIDAYINAGRQRLSTVARLPGLVYGLGTLGHTEGEGPIAPWTTLHYLFFKSVVFTGGVFLLDTEGVALWTEPPGQPWVRQSLADIPPIATALRQRGFISNGLAPDRLFQHPHVLVSAGVETAEGERAGTLVGVIDLGAPEFKALLTAVSTEEGRFAAVVDQNGTVLASTGETATTKPLPGDDAPLLATAPLGAAPWKATTGQPQATALAEIQQLQQLLLWLGIALTLAVLAVGIPFVRGFLRSVEALTRSAEVMAQGDLSLPVDIGERRDELATLAHTFERMRVEIARSRSALQQRLEERDELIRLKEEFLANISHEMRTPLNVILGYADMLLDLPHADTEADLLRRIRSQSEHLFHLLRDLMTLSDLNTGRIELELATVDVPRMLSALEPLVDDLRGGKEVEMIWDYPEHLPALHSDTQRLEQILASLIANAFKFTSQGRVTLRVQHEAAHRRLVFEVSDTGVGIPPEEIPHIFDEFRRVDGSMRSPYGGIGLGLALVRKLTSLLHGDVAVRSDLDCGSTFRVAIPLDPPP